MSPGRDIADSGTGDHPWNPGLSSTIPRDVLPLSTMFSEANVETGYSEAHELADFSGLSSFEVVVFRLERLLVHELLVRVTTDLSVPDGPEYEELGINLRMMVARIYDLHVIPELASLKALHETIRQEATHLVASELATLREPAKRAAKPEKSRAQSLFKRLFGTAPKAEPVRAKTFEEKLADLAVRSEPDPATLEGACCAALLKVVRSVVNHRGRLVGDGDVLVRLAVGLVLNGWSADRLGDAIAPIFETAANAEGYRLLPAQQKPVIMNVKGASASGKSTIRPKQRELAERLGIPWEDFALISPDYWRKYQLEYETLGPVAKYGAMLTGHELEIIDKKLDRYMAKKAKAGAMPHLLIDRFRFDSFNIGDGQTSQLLTRFGDTVFMFFMITPPAETVERAYKRGLTTGRYKAVDDLLHHNVEAYTGMPALFLSWALSKKRVHYEFLDNSVALNEPPKTVAFGWNGSMVILDIGKLLDIERYRKVRVDATNPGEIFASDEMHADLNIAFLKQCSQRIRTIRFADQRTGRVYGLMKDGKWVFRDVDYVEKEICHSDALVGLAALGWKDSGSPEVPPETAEVLEPLGSRTLGQWGDLPMTAQ